jgi:uncharacterized protein YbjT (DUF2867 family)
LPAPRRPATLTGMPILVTGATGSVGGSLVRQLVAAGHAVRALTRHPDSAAARSFPPDVEVVRGDFDDPPSLRPAFRGVDRMHLVAMGGTLDRGEEILALAHAAGVRRLTHLGHDDFSRDDDDPLEADHRTLRRAIERSGLEWTHLFPGEFMTNTWEWAGSIRTESVVRAPFPRWNSSMVHEADVAAVAAVALTEDGHAGRTYMPTGPAPIRRVDAVRAIAAAIGRDITFVELTPDEARERYLPLYGEQVTEWFLEMGRNPETNATVLPDVADVTGRPGRTFAQWAIEHANDFR